MYNKCLQYVSPLTDTTVVIFEELRPPQEAATQYAPACRVTLRPTNFS